MFLTPKAHFPKKLDENLGRMLFREKLCLKEETWQKIHKIIRFFL